MQCKFIKMKTIHILKTLINVLFLGLILALLVTLIFWSVIYFFDDALPWYFKNFKMAFSTNFFSWKILILPITAAINFILFTVAIFFLRKSIKPIINFDFYSSTVTKNLKKAGNIFIIIGISTILIQFIASEFMTNMTQNIVKMNSLITASNVVAATIDLKSIFLIILGLFFLLFSNSFIHTRSLQQENDLTI